ncbi:UNKNOWN [Stylonychia lemnae]|uniref:C2H2-type domain-containing protein n=1 Tax=Stylonychia lemnae TaxID=5949 RepID=A0A078AY14_STYLE|nr:UNKNOWN [Stylonychia lemnae]|eukprot:CDW87011.1 UNKNOWN [Stylonychia lemnae]
MSKNKQANSPSIQLIQRNNKLKLSYVTLKKKQEEKQWLQQPKRERPKKGMMKTAEMMRHTDQEELRKRRIPIDKEQGLSSAIVSQANPNPEKKGEKSEKKNKDTDMLEPKIKKRLIKIYQSSGKAKRWESRWVLHPNSTGQTQKQDKDLWVKKWVSEGHLDPLIELNSDGLSKDELKLLKRLHQIEEQDYAENFYDYQYLDLNAITYECPEEDCEKIFFDLKILKRHMQLKHGAQEKQSDIGMSSFANPMKKMNYIAVN